MKSRWTQQGAREAVERWGGRFGDAFALRLHTARLIGADSTLVLHGGGNVSLKGKHRTLVGDEVEAIYMKGSGLDLAALEPDGLPGIDLSHLRRLRSVDNLTDEQMVNEIRTHLFTASAPTPSIETLLHALLPQPFVDHSHADAVLAVTNQPDGDAMVRDALGDRVAVVPYVRPGFELARAVADGFDAAPDVEGIVLLHHGLVTFGDDARTSYERHVVLVDACERFIDERTVSGASRGTPRGLKPAAQGADSHGLPIDRDSIAPAAQGEEECREFVFRAAPVLRGLLAEPTRDEDRPHRRSILEWRATDEILSFISREDAAELASAGPLTGDHLIYTKPWPMFVADPRWSDDDELRRQLDQAVAAYRRDYEAYVAARGGSTDRIDSSPRIVLLPGAGMLCWGRTKYDACVTADIAEHTLVTKAQATAIGRYTALSEDHLYDMEHRALQRIKLGQGEERALERQVVVISGGAGAIGTAVARVCAEHGAHVVIADLDADRIAQTVQQVEGPYGVGSALGVVMDVTDEESVRSGYAEVVRTYGGVDVIVPNAGIAHVAPIEDMDASDFRRVLEVNATGYLLFMREGIRILKRQNVGGHIVINASKNVFGPGKDFGAYSASKAAGHQLGKVAAIELAPYGIRVNMVNADAIFGDQDVPSGLWSTVGPQRARSRGLREESLPDYYRDRNLLKARVCGHHVGNAVVFFASNATPTTGATLPVDGGVVEAFPR